MKKTKQVSKELDEDGFTIVKRKDIRKRVSRNLYGPPMFYHASRKKAIDMLRKKVLGVIQKARKD
jgi:hypothetical protein